MSKIIKYNKSNFSSEINMTLKESSGYIATFYRFKLFQKINFLQTWTLFNHLILSLILRLLLVVYGEIQDQLAQVSYTDIDYRVLTDGARNIFKGYSPYQRHTYRYSPILAYLQLSNIIIHPVMGKLIYILFDLLVAILINNIVRKEIISQYLEKDKNYNNMMKKNYHYIAKKYALIASCFWLYNPLTSIISTRGNGDCFSSFFIIWTMYLIMACNESIQINEDKPPFRNLSNILFAGAVHGFCIHLRLYPIFFSLAYYLLFSRRLTLTKNFFDYYLQLLYPNNKQLLFALGTIIGLILPTVIFYCLYDWQFIQETYIYHFTRRDSRHNFSLYFLMQYLENINDNIKNKEKLLIITIVLKKIFLIGPQVIIIIIVSYYYSQSRYTIPFCIFLITGIIVTYNTVVTSQYFNWYLALIPLSLHNLHQISTQEALIYFSFWLITQGLWLLPAYLLEFHAWNTFIWIGIQGMCLFFYHNFLLLQIIKKYKFITSEPILKIN